VGRGDSLLTACGPDGALRPLIANWAEVARYLAARLQTEIEHYGGDPVLADHRDAILVGLKRPIPELGLADPPGQLHAWRYPAVVHFHNRSFRGRW
jgi:hypothetical protein